MTLPLGVIVKGPGRNTGGGVALVEIRNRRAGSVRRFGREDWRAKLIADIEYPSFGYRTRGEAIEALVAEYEGVVGG